MSTLEPPIQTIELVLTRSMPALELAISEPTTADADLIAAVRGAPGPKGDPGDVFAELTVDPTILFENALV